MPYATRPRIDSPIAKGTWIMFPTKVLRLVPTNSTLKPNGIRKAPWDPKKRIQSIRKRDIRYSKLFSKKR